MRLFLSANSLFISLMFSCLVLVSVQTAHCEKSPTASAQLEATTTNTTSLNNTESPTHISNTDLLQNHVINVSEPTRSIEETELIQLSISVEQLVFASIFAVIGFILGNFIFAREPKNASKKALAQIQDLQQSLTESNEVVAELQMQLMSKLTEEKLVQKDFIQRFKNSAMQQVDKYVSANTKIAVANLEEAEERMKTVIEAALAICAILQQTKGLRVHPELSTALDAFVEKAQVEFQKVSMLKNRVQVLTVTLSGTELAQAVEHAQQQLRSLLTARQTEDRLLRIDNNDDSTTETECVTDAATPSNNIFDVTIPKNATLFEDELDPTDEVEDDDFELEIGVNRVSAKQQTPFSTTFSELS